MRTVACAALLLSMTLLNCVHARRQVSPSIGLSQSEIAPGVVCKKLFSKARMETLVAEAPDGTRMVRFTVLLMADDQTFTDGPIEEFDDLQLGHPYCAEWRSASK